MNVSILGNMDVILASQSPRRLFLLQAAGFVVEVRPSHIDETPLPCESALSSTQRLCQEKAKTCLVVDDLRPIVAADTLVAIGNEALGQPKDLLEAKQMIQKLSGRHHQVHTTVCVRLGDIYQVETVTTTVSFRKLREAEIDVYVQHNDILDKAGAYAIQGGASGFITGIEGSLDNVIGLPVATTRTLIESVQKKNQRLE